ncbi:MAG: hypothetical protein JSR89_04985 [Proteobacteria bacterium]|nr:hypothetical protein [Pseudomonadota bacterium]
MEHRSLASFHRYMVGPIDPFEIDIDVKMMDLHDLAFARLFSEEAAHTIHRKVYIAVPIEARDEAERFGLIAGKESSCWTYFTISRAE